MTNTQKPFVRLRTGEHAQSSTVEQNDEGYWEACCPAKLRIRDRYHLHTLERFAEARQLLVEAVVPVYVHDWGEGRNSLISRINSFLKWTQVPEPPPAPTLEEVLLRQIADQAGITEAQAGVVREALIAAAELLGKKGGRSS